MSLSAVASRRIQSELKEWQTHPPEGCALELADNGLTRWVILMQGPEGGREVGSRMYAGQLYKLQIIFSPNYPLESPEVTYIPPSVPVHPHIYSNGHICLDVLYDGRDGAWSPALTVSKVCLSLRSMLASNTQDSRPPGDQDYVARVGNRSPKLTSWLFEDDRV